MTAEEYLAYLEQNATGLVTYGPSGRLVSEKRNRTDGRIPTVYSKTNVDILLRALDSIDTTIRFVIDPEGNPYFGSIGPVVGSTPGHEEMSRGLCLAAGVITFQFDDDTNKITGITKISCESGYFKPELRSLIWILQYLCSSGHKSLAFHADTLTIDYYENDNKASIDVPVSSLKSLFETLSPEAAAPSAEQYRTFSDEIPHEQIFDGNTGSPCKKNSGTTTKRPPPTPHIHSASHSSQHHQMMLPPAPKKQRSDFFTPPYRSLLSSCQSSSTTSTSRRFFNSGEEKKSAPCDVFVERKDNTGPNI